MFKWLLRIGEAIILSLISRPIQNTVWLNILVGSTAHLLNNLVKKGYILRTEQKTRPSLARLPAGSLRRSRLAAAMVGAKNWTQQEEALFTAELTAHGDNYEKAAAAYMAKRGPGMRSVSLTQDLFGASTMRAVAKDLMAMKVAELKELLEAREEGKSGNKAWLRRRLHGAILREHLEATGM